MIVIVPRENVLSHYRRLPNLNIYRLSAHIKKELMNLLQLDATSAIKLITSAYQILRVPTFAERPPELDTDFNARSPCEDRLDELFLLSKGPHKDTETGRQELGIDIT